MSINLYHSPVGHQGTLTQCLNLPALERLESKSRKQLRKEGSGSAITSNDQQCLSIHLSYTLTTPCHTMFIAVTNFLLRQRQQSAVASPRRSTGRDLLGLSAVLRRWNQALIRLRVTRENEFYCLNIFMRSAAAPNVLLSLTCTLLGWHKGIFWALGPINRQWVTCTFMAVS